jgi:hypothetical protein
MSQPVGVDVVFRSVDRDPVRVEPGNCLTQQFANRFVISQDLIKNILSLHGIFLQIADDCNLFPFTCED